MIQDLLDRGPIVANLGIEDFASSLESQGVPVVQVEWRPTQELDPSLAALLEELG